jgi:hypothetical protein
MRRILGLLLPLVVFATASLGADLPALQKEVERIRGLSFRAPVAVKEVAPARLREVVRAEMEREFPKDEWPRTEKVLKAFSLIPPRMNLRAVLEGLLEDQVAGLFDPKSRTLYVSTSPLEGEEMLAEAGLKDFSLTDLFLVHELDHALTDQHFGLLSLPLQDRENEDRASAARCLAEGGATWVMVEYLRRRLSKEKAGGLDTLGDEAAAMALGRELLGQSAPAYIQENLLFGYLGGLGLVRAALARGPGRVLTVEDHGLVGGLGSAVCEALSETAPALVRRVAVRGFGESGSTEDLFAKHHLDAAGIAGEARLLLQS